MWYGSVGSSGLFFNISKKYDLYGVSDEMPAFAVGSNAVILSSPIPGVEECDFYVMTLSAHGSNGSVVIVVEWQSGDASGTRTLYVERGISEESGPYTYTVGEITISFGPFSYGADTFIDLFRVLLVYCIRWGLL